MFRLLYLPPFYYYCKSKKVLSKKLMDCTVFMYDPAPTTSALWGSNEDAFVRPRGLIIQWRAARRGQKKAYFDWREQSAGCTIKFWIWIQIINCRSYMWPQSWRGCGGRHSSRGNGRGWHSSRWGLHGQWSAHQSWCGLGIGSCSFGFVLAVFILATRTSTRFFAFVAKNKDKIYNECGFSLNFFLFYFCTFQRTRPS